MAIKTALFLQFMQFMTPFRGKCDYQNVKSYTFNICIFCHFLIFFKIPSFTEIVIVAEVWGSHTQHVRLRCADFWISGCLHCAQYQGQRCWSVLPWGDTSCDRFIGKLIVIIFCFDCYVEYKIICLWKYSSGSRTARQCAFMNLSALLCEQVFAIQLWSSKTVDKSYWKETECTKADTRFHSNWQFFSTTHNQQKHVTFPIFPASTHRQHSTYSW